MTHRARARDLDISPLVAERILQAFRPVVHEHVGIEPTGASPDDVDFTETGGPDDA